MKASKPTSPVIFEQGAWRVLQEGVLEERHGKYSIVKEDLTYNAPSWVEHMAKKQWVNLDDFIACYDFAIKRLA